VPQAERRLNAGNGVGCRMANGKRAEAGAQSFVVSSWKSETTNSNCGLRLQTVACAKLNAYDDELVRARDPAV
jgi:hypothetical protein